ncbi:methyltransferase domain-containing protein [Streptomyces sp. H10-C2]|uniref:methyltransferase domain-containing protein n=1 Tax=unclassified Streptomyces TaxID=2593676 RepID=UPI0024BA8839|nr:MULTISPECIES: methyltransferase domain-containing protein [unclassified Streptomyces]MDJ0341720.1 methyltransferase domain-containing protein [Streptomyces sp. PH10-H1]MDJ0368972.1 methyltransferase domain-containing protein [Streptomyces sp. H10-C2]
MTPTLVRGSRTGADTRARDWAEIQERMLVPLYEAVYDRLEVGPGTCLLGLGCGSGLALLMASARGAAVTGCDPDERRLALARERLLPEPRWGAPARHEARIELLCGGPERTADRAGAPFTMVTALDPASPCDELLPDLTEAARLTEHGSPVVLAGWGPSERCATSRVLCVAARLAEPRGHAVRSRLSGRDDLEEVARDAGLRPDGSGRVACPFGYPDMDSAVRGLISTGLFDPAVEATDQPQVEKELAEALHPYRRADGTVRMENVFRYVVARV